MVLKGLMRVSFILVLRDWFVADRSTRGAAGISFRRLRSDLRDKREICPARRSIARDISRDFSGRSLFLHAGERGEGAPKGAAVLVRAASLARRRRLSTLHAGRFGPALICGVFLTTRAALFVEGERRGAPPARAGQTGKGQRLPPSAKLLAGGLIAAGRSPGSPGVTGCEPGQQAPHPPPLHERLEKRPSGRGER